MHLSAPTEALDMDRFSPIKPHIDYVGIAGITQSYLCRFIYEAHVPCDPRRARIGRPRVNPKISSSTPFWTAAILNPDNNRKAPVEQLGYPVHAHCWILVDRVIGFGLVEANLKIFPRLIKLFWTENVKSWCRESWKYVVHGRDSDNGLDPGNWKLRENPYTLPAW
ncbi:hypothetical protein TSTA_098140 [Talaromyces stipitatus ATCC 10500]|uniref:Uncharacterized protein n=1 Tax=Talaromyces stipitatus (strain ATCC 10500 / CBS 375.48 / QM 6759 / NRRL 1006) TaxID=441959 RepID=B8MM45_TALSN|nr:uncharacterized protein TSTA_098140 [Talaromyces stipitatus ATCC 10500]EED13557.1 hypothetical protein TSTA_098140 [Talaromyces stipitatus ATCC 10500]